MSVKWVIGLTVVIFLAAGFVAFLLIGETVDYQVCAAEFAQKNLSGSPIYCSARVIDIHDGIVTAIATIVIALFTALLVCVTTIQTSLTKEVLAVDKRAFVYADDIRGFCRKDSATNTWLWRFRPTWHNSGDTPTKHMRMFVDCELRTSVLPPGFNFDYNAKEPGKTLIPPKSKILGGLAPAQELTPQDIQDVQNGRKFLYLWGWAKYHDVFPGTREHITRFCWMIDPVGDPFAFDLEKDSNGLKWNCIHHYSGNCADDECDARI